MHDYNQTIHPFVVLLYTSILICAHLRISIGIQVSDTETTLITV